ncbi:MAG: EAL domain-containing protein [Pseudomonadota bacterium]
MPVTLSHPYAWAAILVAVIAVHLIAAFIERKHRVAAGIHGTKDRRETAVHLSRERSQEIQRFRAAFADAPIGSCLLDADGIALEANRVLLDLFWPDSARAPAVDFSDVIVDQDRENFARGIKRLVNPRYNKYEADLSCIAADGDTRQVSIQASAARGADGAFLCAVVQLRDVTDSVQLTNQLELQASTDELTGLLNRRAFQLKLQQAWESGASSGKHGFLMFMDLDQFKVVNDTSGHAAGDRLLKRVGEILTNIFRSNDTIARLGGDEFGVILWECADDVAARLAESVRASIEQFRFRWDTETYRIGISIGGIPIDPAKGDVNELQQLADAACYTAKEAGRNCVHMVAGGKDSARLHRKQVRWVQRIRDAMDRNRFAIYAQPIRSLDGKDENLDRLEILLRLRDSTSRNLILPGAFLPAAERYGLSVELDRWVVRRLLHMLMIHKIVNAERRSYWINLSASSIGDTRFAGFLKDAIRRTPLPAGTINFEITETTVIRNLSEAGRLVADLRELGCQVALDDFGSGMSSINYLKELPINVVKIDGSFIRNLATDVTDRIFVRSIIDIAHALNIKTTAEFVENKELLEIIKGLGADFAQGHAIAQPFVLAPRFPATPAPKAGANNIVQLQAG